MKFKFLRLTSLVAVLGTLSISSAIAGSDTSSNPLTSNINQMIKEKRLPGMVVVVRKNNQVIHHQAYGYADIEKQTPMTTDRLFHLHSMTKPITALTTLKVLEDKGIALDSPLQAIFPQFKTQVDIPLSTVMNHTAGFSYGFKINRWAGWLYLFSNIGGSKSLADFVDRLADLPLLSDPGVRWRYSFSSDLQGAMVEQLSDKTLFENMNEKLFTPLGMFDTSFHVQPSRAHRLLPMYSDAWFSNSPAKEQQTQSLQAKGPQSGGSGLVSTAMDYSKFVQLLMTPNAYPDIVNPEQIALMTNSQLPEAIPTIPQRYYPNSGYSYGLGVKLEDEDYMSKGSFFWAGRGGTIFWGDPKNNLSVVVMMQYEGGNKMLEKALIPMIYQWLDKHENTAG